MIRLRFISRDPEADRDRRWAAWIGRMAQGDLDALSSLYDESSRVIFSLVVGILHDREAAEDVLVEIYNRARLEAGKFRAWRESPLSWLISMARDRAVRRLRSRAAVLDPAADPFEQKRHIANFALAGLSGEQRSILEMTYMAGLTAPEVAGVLGVTEAQVKQQIVSALDKLRAASENPSGGVVRMSRVSSM